MVCNYLIFLKKPKLGLSQVSSVTFVLTILSILLHRLPQKNLKVF